MNQQLKQRLVGACVLIVSGIIFLPMILEAPYTPENQVNSSESSQPLRKLEQEKTVPEQFIPEEVLALENQHGDKAEVAPVNLKTETQTPEVKPNSNSSPQLKPAQSKEESEQWLVQLGSFSNYENASKLVERLKQKQYSAYFEETSGDGKKIYRVKVGPEQSREKADKLKSLLDKEENLNSLIVRIK